MKNSPSTSTHDFAHQIWHLEHMRATMPELHVHDEDNYRGSFGQPIAPATLTDRHYIAEVSRKLAAHGVPDIKKREEVGAPLYLALKLRGWGPTATAHALIAALEDGILG